MAVNQETRYTKRGVNKLAENVTFTDSWQDIGFVLNCHENISLTYWLDIEVNDSTDIYFRPVSFMEENTDEFYLLPTEEIHTGVNKFYPKSYQLQKVEDQRVVFQVNPAEMLPYIGIQIIDKTTGIANRAILKSIYYSARF